MNFPAGQSPRLASVFDHLTRINQRAYRQVALLSNQVLSKNPFTNSFINNFVAGREPEPVSPWTVLLRLLRYYLASVVCLGGHLLNVVIFLIWGARFKPVGQQTRELILIDVFISARLLSRAPAFHDSYFPGLVRFLESIEQPYVYLPVWAPWPKPWDLILSLRKLRATGVPVWTEYQILTATDLLAVLGHILAYPFQLMNLVRSIPREQLPDRVLRAELMASLSQVTFPAFMRYRQGRRLAARNHRIKVIGWFENQVIDKNLYRGLRSGPARVTIYGAQPFIYATSILNILVDDGETDLGLTPDLLVVNGPYYLNRESRVPSVVGASFRYARLFQTPISFADRRYVLVLLPYFKDILRRILEVVSGLDWPTDRLWVKFHPTTRTQKTLPLLPRNARLVTENLYDLFPSANVVVGAASGSMIEAAALGIPGVVIENPDGLTHNPYPELGRGVIWETAADAAELSRGIASLERRSVEERTLLTDLAAQYRKMFFCQPSEEAIIKAFDL